MCYLDLLHTKITKTKSGGGTYTGVLAPRKIYSPGTDVLSASSFYGGAKDITASSPLAATKQGSTTPGKHIYIF